MDTPRGKAAPPGARHRPLLVGALLTIGALLSHKWALERLFVPDEHLASGVLIGLVVIGQALLVAFGVRVARRRDLPPLVTRLTLVAALVLIAIGGYGTLRALRVIDPHEQLRTEWQAMVQAEEQLLALGPQVGALTTSLLDLALPTPQLADRLFAEEVRVVDALTRGEARRLGGDSGAVARADWSLGDPVDVSRRELALLQPVIASVSFFSQAKFKLVRGDFRGPDLYVTDLHLSALGKRPDGAGYRAVSADIAATWTRVGEDAWRLSSWDTEHLATDDTPALLYEDVLDTALSAGDAARARRSEHEDHVVRYYTEGDAFEPPHIYFGVESVEQSPAIAVADVDTDGLDDLLVMPRFGPNLLLRATGQGRFEDVAATWGVADLAHAAGAALVDFDNDGDPDLLLARTAAPSRYLLNEGGRFVDRTDELVTGSLPWLATTVAVADYDQDGLLDAYIGTYSIKPPGPPHLDEATAAEVVRRQEATIDGPFTDRWGPPNVLLRGAGGGRLEVVEAPHLELFRDTLQATWTDFDRDGDADLYVANDFGPNHLFRNEGGGELVDVTAELTATGMGFSMGVTWGDYDEDGRPDLYISNMYSKAGRRITARITDIDPRLVEMARGNALFRNTADGFVRVSGAGADDQHVEKAGWSWGSQFVDVDRDGDLDLYALSGHYSAPAEVALAADR